MKTIMNLILAAAAAMAVLAAGALMDGPSEQEAAEATQASLQDAIEQARKHAAQPIDYELIEPTPAYILHRYAELAGSKQ